MSSVFGYYSCKVVVCWLPRKSSLLLLWLPLFCLLGRVIDTIDRSPVWLISILLKLRLHYIIIWIHVPSHHHKLPSSLSGGILSHRHYIFTPCIFSQVSQSVILPFIYPRKDNITTYNYSEAILFSIQCRSFRMTFKWNPIANAYGHTLTLLTWWRQYKTAF